MLFENLLSYDQSRFIDVGRKLLQKEKIRFHIKNVLLEVLGQAETINRSVEVFLKEYLSKDYWKNHLIHTVFMGHPIFVEFLIREGYISKWLKSELNRDTGFMLLRSISKELSDEITLLLYPLAFSDVEIDYNIYRSLCWNIEDDSESMFNFRLKILTERPQFWTYNRWDGILDVYPDRAIQMFDILVRSLNENGYERQHKLTQKIVEKFLQVAQNNPKHIWTTFMTYLAESTANITDYYDTQIDFWITKQYMRQNLGRTYIKMIKVSAQELAYEQPKTLLTLCEPHSYNSSVIVNEILLYVMELLPSEYSDYALNWLIAWPYQRLFNYTGEEDDYLYSAKRIIEKHSKICSDETFRKVENALYYFHGEDELWLAKRRFNSNKKNREEGNWLIVYWPYWGKVQFDLLPVLDCNKTSKRTKELIIILQRRFNNSDVMYKRNKVRGGWFSSPIGTIELSDKQWLRIIENKKIITTDVKEGQKVKEQF